MRLCAANWMIYAANNWLRPIYDLLRAELIANEILHADETTVQVVKERGRSAAQKSYMWMYHTGRDAVRQAALFEYQATREGVHALDFLAGFKGYLHVDGYAGYKKLEDQGVILVECWAHVRRKFFDTLKTLKKEDRANAVASVGLD